MDGFGRPILNQGIITHGISMLILLAFGLVEMIVFMGCLFAQFKVLPNSE
jgi:hypothetical protein